jgi:hypothetical protein
MLRRGAFAAQEEELLQVAEVVLFGRARVAPERDSEGSDEEEKQGECDQFHDDTVD